MAVVLRLPDRPLRAVPSPQNTALRALSAEIVILPCIRRERLTVAAAEHDALDLPTQLQA